jgi:hypothetical protein
MQGLRVDGLGEKHAGQSRGQINQLAKGPPPGLLFKTCGKVIGKIPNSIISQGNQSIA